MSSQTDSAQGPAGTARIDTPAPGPAGTARIATPASGATGTARIEPAATAGPAGTARVEATPAAKPQGGGAGGTARIAPVAGPAGTARVGEGGAASVDAVADAQAEPGEHLMVGQTVQLHGASFQVEAALSTTTSEARTYVVRQGAQRLVLKHYRRGLHAPLAPLAALQAQPHPNVVAIHAFGTEAGQDFELLEYFPAGTLDHLLRHEGPLQDLDRLRRLVSQLADGLEHLHERVGLIYQDLKPENVLISGPDLTRVVLADFGISTMRVRGAAEVQVTANGTREYAAPELARFGNETQTLVTEKVDYFALGISLLECWQGQRPFQGVPDGRRVAQVQDREVPFPAGMDAALETLIKGLLSPSVKQRFGLEQVRRWVANQALEVDYTRTERVYERLAFRGDAFYQTPAELAALLKQYPVLGLDYLYLGTIGKWLEGARDMELATQIEKIVRQFDQDDAQRHAGLLRAIYTLDMAAPFVTVGGRACTTSDELGDAMLAERAHYVDALSQAFEPFYLYLQARGEGDFATETRARFLGDQGADLAFNQLVYALHSGNRNRVQIAGQYYFLPEDLADAPAPVQDALAEQLQEDNSRVLLWLQRLGIVEELKALHEAKTSDQLSIMRAFPWLRLVDFVDGLDACQGAMAWDLIKGKRLDLLDEFVAQGLDFNAPAERWRPLVTAAANNQLQAVAYMLDHGADIEVVDGDGDTALLAAVQFRRSEMLELLLARGANAQHVRPDGQTALALALLPTKTSKHRYEVEPAMVQRVLQTGADANQPGAQGRLPLHLALVQEQPEQALALLEMLLAHRADVHRAGPNIVVDQQQSCAALFIALYAMRFQHRGAAAYLPVIARLLQAGARVDTLDQGKAPLHWAALWGYEDLAKLLLQHGASRDQVGADAMLPGAYARVSSTKVPAFDKLLAPSAGLLWRGRMKQASASLLQALALALWLLPLVGMGMMVRNLGYYGVPQLVLLYAILMLSLLVLRALLAGSWRALAVQLKAAAATAGGWGRWLVGGPVVLGLVAASSTGALTLLGGTHFWGSWDWTMAGLAVAVVVSLVSIYYSARVSAYTAAYDKYREVGGGSGKKPKSVWRTMLVPLLTAGVLATVVFALAGWFGSMVGKPARSLPAAELGSGTLSSRFVVVDPKKPSCQLPAGTVLTLHGVAMGRWPEPRYNVSVPKPPAECGDWLSATVVTVPQALVRRSGTAASAPPKPQPAAAAKPQAPAVVSVAGVVQGLSAEGWPRINGRAVPLYGVTSVAASQRGRFESWLRGHENYLDCESVAAGRSRCLTRGKLDVAEALLLNGVATASADAPAHYTNAMAQAKSAQRGQWK